MKTAFSVKKSRLLSILLAVIIVAGLMLPMTATAETTVSVADAVLVEAENMTTDGHVIAEKTETSVKATYANGTGDDWLAHGGYANYILRENQKVYVRARSLVEGVGSRQLSIRYNYTDATGGHEYFFHIPASAFKNVNEYQDIELSAPELIGCTVTEIVLFGNAAEREPVEIDKIWIDTVSASDSVIAEFEDSGTVCPIAIRTDSSLIANFEQLGSDECIAWGYYVNYTLPADKKIYIRARTLAEGYADWQFAVRYTYNDGSGSLKEKFFHIPSSVFNAVNVYQDIELTTPPELYGALVTEITLFGNVAASLDCELDCIFERVSYNSDYRLLEAESLDTSTHPSAEKTENSVKAVYSAGGDDWLGHGGRVPYTVNPEEQVYVRARALAQGTDNWLFAVRYSNASGVEKFFHIPGTAFATVGDYYDIPLVANDIMGFEISEIVLFGNSAEAIPCEIDCLIVKEKNPDSTVILEAERMNPVNIAVKTDSSLYVNYPVTTGDHCIAWGGYMNGYTLNKYDKNIYVRVKMLETLIREVQDAFTIVVNFSDGSPQAHLTIGSDDFKLVGEYVDIKLDSALLHNKPMGEVVIYGNMGNNVNVEIDNLFTTEIISAGDTNIDGSVDILDLVRAKKYVAQAIGSDAIALKNANLDTNVSVDGSDLVLLRKMLLGE